MRKILRWGGSVVALGVLGACLVERALRVPYGCPGGVRPYPGST